VLAADFRPDANGSFRSHQGDGLFRNVTYASTAVELQNLLALQGDTDGDRDINTADLTRVISGFTGAAGSGATWLTGDIDGDEDVDSRDVARAIINFTGARNAAAAGAVRATAVGAGRRVSGGCAGQKLPQRVTNAAVSYWQAFVGVETLFHVTQTSVLIIENNDDFHTCPNRLFFWASVRAACDEIKGERLSVSENPLTSPPARLGNGWEYNPVDF